MRLLFDQNLSPRLVGMLRYVFPDSIHLMFLGLNRASDAEVFEYAREHGYAIVAKDADFHGLSRRRGAPPMVIWLGIGNCETRRVEELLRERREEISQTAEDPGRHIFRLLP